MKPLNDNSTMFSGLDGNPCILMRLSDITFAIPIACVEDVFTTPAITPVPLAHRHVVGLLNLRGKVMTVLCLACRLGLKRPDLQFEETLTIGVSHKGESHGLIVPDVGEVVALPVEQREPVPAHFHAGWISCAAGLHKRDDQLIVELDVAALLHVNDTSQAA